VQKECIKYKDTQITQHKIILFTVTILLTARSQNSVIT